ncbi:MAG: ATP-binding protein [Planctomycetota bacterium]|jgi:serine/threonine-protein kinase RsbW
MSQSGINPSGDGADAGRSGEVVLRHGDTPALKGFEATIFEGLKAAGFDEGEIFAIRLAMEEAIANGFRHGNEGDPAKSVTVAYGIDGTGMTLAVEDQGTGFDPTAVPDPTEDANLEIPSGRGLMLMRAYMTEVLVIPPGNRIEMRFDRQV